MDIVTVSPKYQVVIPRAIRKMLGIKAGHKFQVIQYGDRIELIPFTPAKSMRGFLRGIDTTIPTEEDRI